MQEAPIVYQKIVDYLDGKAKPLTWKNLFDYNIEFNLYKLRKKSKEDYLSTFVRFSNLVDVDRVINQQDADLFYSDLRSKMKEQSASMYFKKLRACYNFAFKKQRTDIKIIFDIIEFEAPKKNIYLTPDDFEKLINVVERVDHKFIFMFLLNTGCRIAELLTLTTDRIFLDCEKPYYYLPAELTKEKKEKRVPLFGDALIATKELLKLSNSLPYLTNIRHQNTINSNLEKYCKLANIQKITCHTFRHTFSTWASDGLLPFMNGNKLDSRAKKMILGHSATSMITEDYTHLDFNYIYNQIPKDS